MSRAAPDLDDWLTTEEVAEHFGVPTRVIVRMIRDEKLPATKKGWVYLVHRSDLPASIPYTARS